MKLKQNYLRRTSFLASEGEYLP